MSAARQELVSLHQDNLQRAIDFLKFAEAKNGAAIAFASALILTALQLHDKLTNFGLLELLGIVFALLGGLVSARSFVPVLSWKSVQGDESDNNRNLLFFADIGKMTAESFKEEFRKRAESEHHLIDDLSVQTVANSRIATNKMNHFSIAAFLLLAGFLLLSLSVILELLSRF